MARDRTRRSAAWGARLAPGGSGPDHRIPAWAVTATAALILVGVGLLAQRAELVVLGTPFMIMTLVRIGAGAPRLAPDRDQTATGEGLMRVPVEAGPVTRRGELERVVVDSPGPAEVMHVLCPVAGASDARMEFALPVSGRAVIGRYALATVASDGLAAGDWTPTVDVEVRSWPAVSVRRTPAPQPRRLIRNPGSHRSRMPGSGTDPKDIRPITPSDSLRDVDWRATARSPRPEELLVRERFAENQGTVRLCVDTTDDLAWDPITWYHPRLRTVRDDSILTNLRAAALTLATVHVQGGDRVGLSQINDGGIPVPAATGNRQLDRLRAHLGELGAAKWRRPWRRVVSPPQPGSLIYVVSTFLDPMSLEKTLEWLRHGHRVIAVDIGGPLDRLDAATLHGLVGYRWRWMERWLRPDDDPRLTVGQAMACRLALALRTAHLSELRHAAVEMITWSSPNATALSLVQLDRGRQARAGGRRLR